VWNLFEQPWTLVGLAVIVLLGVLTYRSVWPEGQRWWQWFLPVAVAGLGFGLDFAVTTDLEKINHLLRTSIRAAENEDCVALGRLIAPDYEDSVHKSKEALLELCRARLVPPTVDRIKVRGKTIEITSPDATMTLTMQVSLDPKSYWVRAYQMSKPLVTVQIRLRKQADGNWLVTRIEVVEVNKVGVNWGMAKDCCRQPGPMPLPA
jgi:hypothetical protein